MTLKICQNSSLRSSNFLLSIVGPSEQRSLDLPSTMAVVGASDDAEEGIKQQSANADERARDSVDVGAAGVGQRRLLH